MLHIVHGLFGLELWLPWDYIVPIDLYWGKLYKARIFLLVDLRTLLL